MKNLLEMMKIIEGALKGDSAKVEAYTAQLADRIEADGDAKSAERLRRMIQSPSKMRHLSLSRSSKPSGSVPVDSESRFSLAEECFYERGEVHLFLDQSAQATVDQFLQFAKAADQLIANGVGISPSLLAVGPPGCGKTELAHLIASELRLPLLTARMDGLVSSYLGSTAKNLRQLFEHAMGRPCVLLLDDFDAVAKLRDDRHELGELKRVVVSLLQNIDNLDGHTVLLATTNHPHLLDSAIWRRFAYKVELYPPALEARAKMLSRFLSSFLPEGHLDLLASLSDGLTGAEIRQFSEDAKRAAILAGASMSMVADVVRRIIDLRVGATVAAGNGDPLAARVRAARALNPKLLSYRLLEDVFGVNKNKIAAIIHAEE